MTIARQLPPLTWDERAQLLKAVELLDRQAALITAMQEELLRVRAERDVLFVTLGRKQTAPGMRVCVRCQTNLTPRNVCTACKSAACRAAAIARNARQKNGVLHQDRRSV